MNKTKILIFLMWFFSVPALAFQEEDDWVEWRQLGGWLIETSASLSACSIVADFPTDGGEQTSLFVIHVPSVDHVKFVLTDNDWEWAVEGQTTPIQIDMGRGRLWNETDAITFFDNGLHGITIPFEGSEFITDFASGEILYVHRDGQRIARLDISSNREAIAELARCADSVQGAEPPASAAEE